MPIKLKIDTASQIWVNGRSSYFGYMNSNIDEISRLRDQQILDIDGVLSIFLRGPEGQNIAISVDPQDAMNPERFPEVYIEYGLSDEIKNTLALKISELFDGLFVREE